jgi:Protein of unknown function DUF72
MSLFPGGITPNMTPRAHASGSSASDDSWGLHPSGPPGWTIRRTGAVSEGGVTVASLVTSPGRRYLRDAVGSEHAGKRNVYSTHLEPDALDDAWRRFGHALDPLRAAEKRYLYSTKELAAWVEPIRGLAHEANETHALMNNCYQDYGVRNAYDLAKLLDEGVQPDAPVPNFGANQQTTT